MVIYVRLEKVMKNLKVQTFKAGVDLPTFNFINKKKIIKVLLLIQNYDMSWDLNLLLLSSRFT